MPQDPKQPSQRSYACQLTMLVREISAAAARLLADHDVTHNQAMLLRFVYVGETNPGRIASHMAVDASNLSRLIRTAEDRGWITRKTDPDNRTRVILELTDEGTQTVEAIDPHAQVIQDVIAQCLEGTDPESFLATIRQITEALEHIKSFEDHPAIQAKSGTQ